MRSFCIAKASLIFFQQKISVYLVINHKTLTELTRSLLANDTLNDWAQVYTSVQFVPNLRNVVATQLDR